MRRWLGAALVCGWVLVLGACTSKKEGAAAGPAPLAKAPENTTAVLMISADVRGYVGPCGCSENMQGGIARAAEQVLRARKEGAPLLYLDGGNSLFSTDELWPREVPQSKRRAEALAEAMKRMGVVARASGRYDLAVGEAFVAGLGLPELPPGNARVLDAGSHRVGVVAAKSIDALATAGRRARADGAEFVVGFLEEEFAKAQREAQQAHGAVDLIVATLSPGWFDAEENRLVRGDVPVVAVQSKGRSLLRVDLAFLGGDDRFTLRRSSADRDRELRATDERIELLREQTNDPTLPKPARDLRQGKLEELIDRREALARADVAPPQGANTFGLRFVVLESNLPSDPETAKLVEAYDRDVSKLNLAWARQHGRDCPQPAEGEAAFVGNDSCESCHAQAFPVWRKSKHAMAYETLEQRGKQFHLDCVGCHVTGFEQPGGVCRMDKVEGREDVGCESCHGPGSLHAKAPKRDNIVAVPTEKNCIGCHNPENSPHFEFVRYLPQILGPGHRSKTAE